MCPVTFPCTCSCCSSSSIRPVLPKIEVRLTEIIPTLVARLLNPNMTSSDPNPNFQCLHDLCLTQYSFSGDHSSIWVWCHPHRVLPLARGLTLHINFVLEDITGFTWNPSQCDFEPSSLDYHNPMKFSNFVTFPNLIPITLFHRAEAQNGEFVLFLSMHGERFRSHPLPWVTWVGNGACLLLPWAAAPRRANAPTWGRICRCRDESWLQESWTPTLGSIHSCSGMFEQEKRTRLVMEWVKFYKESRCACLKDKLFPHATIR